MEEEYNRQDTIILEGRPYFILENSEKGVYQAICSYSNISIDYLIWDYNEDIGLLQEGKDLREIPTRDITLYIVNNNTKIFNTAINTCRDLAAIASCDYASVHLNDGSIGELISSKDSITTFVIKPRLFIKLND